MISLDRLAQKRLAARIAARERGGPKSLPLADQVLKLAGSGWAPDIIGGLYGRSARWAKDKMNGART